MSKKNLPYINHVLDAINDIEESVNNLSKEEFKENKDIREANVRRLEIIGEAIKNISENLKDKYKDIPWKDISGMRDKLIHHYFGVNWDTVWTVIKEDISDLKKKIIKIKNELKEEL